MRLNTHPVVAKLLIVLFTLLVVVFGTSLLLTAVTSAQTVPMNETTTPTGTPIPPPDDGERIEPGLVLLDSSVEDGVATLTFRADDPVSVTLADAGAFYSEQDVATKTVVLQEGTQSLELPVTRVSGGAVGVSISTADTLTGELIEGSSALISGPWTGQHVQVAAISGAVSIAVITLFVAFRRMFGSDETVERVA